MGHTESTMPLPHYLLCEKAISLLLDVLDKCSTSVIFVVQRCDTCNSSCHTVHLVSFHNTGEILDIYHTDLILILQRSKTTQQNGYIKVCLILDQYNVHV